MRPSRRGAAIVALLAAAVLGAVALGWFPQRPLGRLLETRLRQLVGPKSRIGSVRVVPGRLSAEVRGLVLDSPTYRLEADRVRVALSRETLFRPGLFVNRLEMEGGRILLRTPAEPVPLRPPPAGPIVIRGIAITGVTVQYEDPDLGGAVVLRQVDVRGSLGEGALEGTAAGGVWQRAEPVALGPLRARLRISPRLDLHVESLEAGLERTRVRLAGSLGRVGALRPVLGFDLEAHLAEIQTLAGIAPASGMVSGEGTIGGSAGALAVEAALKGQRLQVSGWPLDSVTAHVRHDGRDGSTTGRASLWLMGGKGALDARRHGKAVEGRLSVTAVDLARLQRQLGRSPAGVAGTGSATVGFEGDLGERLRIEAHAEATGRAGEDLRFDVVVRASGPVRLPRPSLDLAWTATVTTDAAARAAVPAGRLTAAGTARGPLPPAIVGHVGGILSIPAAQGPVPVTVEGDLRSRGDAAAGQFRLTGLGGEAEGSVEMEGTRVRAFELQGRSLDLAPLLEGARGRAEVQLRAAGPLDALSGTGRVRVESVAWRSVELGSVRADVEARGGRADIRAALPRFNATALSQLVPGPRREGMALRGTVGLAGTPLGPLAPLLPRGRPLEGTLSGTVEFDLPLSAPARATARGQIERLDLRSGAFAARNVQPFAIALARGRLAIDALHLTGEGFSVQAAGSVGLEPGNALDLRATAQVDLGALPAPPEWSVHGQGRAEVKVAGTRAAPRATGFVSVDQAVLESPTLPPVRVASGRLDLEGDAVRTGGLRAELADGAIVVSGRVPLAAFWPEARRRPGPLSKEEEAGVTIVWTGIEAGQLLRRLRPQQQATVEARLAGQAELRGGLASLQELRATVGLPATTARVQDLALELSPAEIGLQNGRISTSSVELRAAGGALGLSGSVDLLSRTLDVASHGSLELRALSPFLEEAALTGRSEVDLRVGGSLDAPRPEGTVRVRQGTLRLRTLPQALTGLTADAVLDGSTLRLTSASATLGGGTLSMAGAARLDGAKGLADARFTLTGRGLALRYPEGMRSRLDADLTLSGRTGALELAGTVKALRGLYDLDAALEESLTAPVAEATRSPLLRSVALDILVLTESPVLVRNNLAHLQATGRLSVRGDLETPVPIGTLETEPGGKVFLQGREFVIGSGRLAYSGTWDPELAVEATARIPDLDRRTGLRRADVSVTVGLRGRLSRPALELRSDPPYSQVEIVNLIATGDSQNPSARLAVGGPAAALLAGRLTSRLRGLGLDEVSIQPELVAREGEVEPGARFTFGKRLYPRVNLVYSLSLQDPESRFFELELSPGRDVELSVRRTDAGSFRYGAGQRFRFGGRATPDEASEQRVRVVEVRLEGDRPLEPAELRAAIRTGAGERKTVWDLQDDADRLRERLVAHGYLEAEVGARFEGQVAVFTVRSGDRYRWTVEGLADPPDLSSAIRSSLFEEEALERGRARLLEVLRDRGHLRAVVDTRTVVADGSRQLVFTVRPGPVVQADVEFPGAEVLSPSRLLAAAGGAGRLLSDPDAAVADILAAYRAAHHLAAEVDRPRVVEEGGGSRLRVVVPVREGPRARVAAVRFEGTTLAEADLARVAGLATGADYDEDQVLAAADRLRSHYFGLGHPAVRVSPRLEVRGSDVAVVFQVAEGERVSVAAVVLQGLRRTRQSLVAREVNLRPGDPLDPRKVAELERRLLDLGLFTRAAATVSDGNPATITVTLEEGDRVRAGYLLSYNDDKGSRAEVDGELRSLMGAGLSLGGRLSAGPDLRDARAYLNVPSLPTGRMTLAVFRLAEDLPLVAGEQDGQTFERVQVGGQIQATRPLGGRWNVLYGYRFKRSTVTSPFLTSSRKTAGLDVSLLRDTRDSPLDARRGLFLSLSLEVAPKALGSDFDFVKGLAQVFVNRPLGESFTWAQGYRLGLAHPFRGEPLVIDEGFEAGGANSMRGFDPGEVGPADYPFGREAVVVVNQELRYRHRSGLGGVVFYDTGNTFSTLREVSLSLRHVLGAGLRWSSPVGLLRVDLGMPLGRREGESAYEVFFSFGQAF